MLARQLAITALWCRWKFVAKAWAYIRASMYWGELVCVERYKSESWYKLGINGSETA